VPGVEVYVPIRVLPNGSGSTVLFTLFQLPGMSDEKYAEDAGFSDAGPRDIEKSAGEVIPRRHAKMNNGLPSSPA